MEDSTTFELKLPGFRFHPTDEEILSFYLKNMIFQKGPRVDVIGFLDIYHHEPWDLPGLAKTKTGEREWYFFVPREGRKGRPNRTTEKGFWKATGCERKVISLSNPKKMIGLKKTLVFYKGRAPRGCRTDWIMNEFRLPPHTTCPTLKAIVLCKIYRKATSLKVLEQKAEEETSKITCAAPITTAPSSIMVLKEQDDEEENDAFFVGNQQKNNEEETSVKSETSSSNRISFGEEKLADLVVPKPSVDWTDDPFWTTLPSPWLDNWAFYALNF